MEQHALAFLEQKDLWNWLRIQASGKQGDNLKVQVVTPKLLYFLIVESQR